MGERVLKYLSSTSERGGAMSEIVNNLDIAVRLAILIEMGVDMDNDTKKLCKDALGEIERLRAENKKLRRA